MNRNNWDWGLFWELVKICFILLGIIATLVCGIDVLIYSFQNPTLTRTQISMYSISHYWWAHILLVVSAFLMNSFK